MLVKISFGPHATPRFYLVAVEKNQDKVWDHCYVTCRSEMEDSVHTNQVYQFQSVM